MKSTSTFPNAVRVSNTLNGSQWVAVFERFQNAETRLIRLGFLIVLSLQSAALSDVCPAPVFAAAPTFQPNYNAGSRPEAVAVGDLNGDGKPDLAVALDESGAAALGNVAILLNNGDGTFGTGTNFGLAIGRWSPATSVAISDFNGDGKPDLVIANKGLTNVSIVLGIGDGSFGSPTNFAVGVNPSSVAAGDFNGDGRSDLAVANSGSTNVSILLGNGDGSFQSATDYLVGVNPSFVSVGDFNGDRKLDLAVANQDSNELSILVGRGDGTFLLMTNYPAGKAPHSIASGDFNHDGKLDLAVGNLGSLTNGTIVVFLGVGDGTFQTTTNYSFTSSATFVAAADLNGDGIVDLVNVGGQWRPGYPDRSSQNVNIMLGKGDGTFQPSIVYTAGYNPICVATGDFNSDGRADLVVANNDLEFAGSVAILLGIGDGTFPSPIRYVGSSQYRPEWGHMATGDFNGDGIPDLVVPMLNDWISASVLIGNGDGTFRLSADYTLGGDVIAVAVGDYNGDRKLDLAMTGQDGAVWIFLGKGDGTFQREASFPIETAVEDMTVGDFNRDNKLDLAVAAFGGGDVISILLGNGDGTFQSKTNLPVGGAPYKLVTADFDGDSNQDLAVSSIPNVGPPGRVTIFRGNGDGTFQSPVEYDTGQSPWSLTTGDFNGDGKPDLATASLYPGAGVWVLLNKGDGTFAPAVKYWVSGISLVLNFVGAGDFNGDGKIDLATGGVGDVAFLLGNGDGTFQSPVFYGVARDDTAPLDCALADFNGDGALDIAVQGSGLSVMLNACASPRPALAISRNGSSINLSWPYPSSSFALQSAASLSTTNWLPVLQAPATNNASLEVTVPIGPQARFFRLRKP